MLILGSRLINASLMSLQTGGKLASLKSALIDPGNLKIIAYEVEGALLASRPSFIRTDDIREVSHLGVIVDSNDELIELSDVIAVQKIYDLGFNLNGMRVIDDRKRKIGKVSDYSVDIDSFFVQQLQVRQSGIKGLTDSTTLVSRTQIVEINNTHIVVRSATVKVEPIEELSSPTLAYVNPFRSPQRQSEPSSGSS